MRFMTQVRATVTSERGAPRGIPCRAPPAHRGAGMASGIGSRLVIQWQRWNDGCTDFLQDTWPRALPRLEALAESTHREQMP
jgi:hypothetical protein